MIQKHDDPNWGVHEKHWRALGDRLAKLTMDNQDWMDLGWTAQDRRSKEFTRILTKVLPKSGLIEEHDQRVRMEALIEAAHAIEDVAGGVKESNNGEDDTVSIALGLAAKLVRALLDNPDVVDTIDS